EDHVKHGGGGARRLLPLRLAAFATSPARGGDQSPSMRPHMTVRLASSSNSVRDRVSAEEWAARVDLAAGHRVLAHYGVNDLTYNHFGLRVPGEPDRMLIKRTDWMFSEVTASSLLKVDFDGNVLIDTDVETIKGGALIIHAGLLRHRRDLNATLHTHTVGGMGVAAHKFGLL